MMSHAASEMDESRMLSGSQIVAKGATKKADGQLPEVGLKDVSRNGSWLEQKQIQSALEARKHLIAVERIEKSGSLSHAVWRDDLQLAEVTKQTGSHWQYIGHKRGKYLYLLPEETLFLMETNSLLLKHNEVTVSLQKAYPLCLSEFSIMQYKVYASLSRIGYRVFRHKEPTNKTNELIVNKETTGTTIEERPEISRAVSINTEQSDSESRKIINNDDSNMEVTDDYIETLENSTNNLTNEIPPKNIPVNNEGTTNDVDKVVNESKNKSVDDITNIEKVNNTIIVHSNGIVNDNTSEQNKETTTLTLDVDTNNVHESNTNESVTSRMDIDDNANKTIVTTHDNALVELETIHADSTVTSRHESVGNAVAGETSNDLTIVYSVDEFGVIRAYEKNNQMDTNSTKFFVANDDIDSTYSNPDIKDSSDNDTFKHYLVELRYCDDRIKKLTERKSNYKRSNQILDTIQDFYKKQIVKVNVPDEAYLPRNIFLHKTEYKLNIELVRTQNASNINNDETDSIGSSSTPAQDLNSQRLTELPRLGNYTQLRHPAYQQQRTHYNPRLNFNNIMLRSMPSFFGHPRYHPNAYVRQHYNMAHNISMPGVNVHNQINRRDTIKKYHYDMIVNIAMRLKHGLAFPAQVRALHNLVNTFNSRYNTYIRMTPDFNVIGTPETVPDQNVIDLDDDKVPLDVEPKRKKPRLNDDDMTYKSNLAKLKDLATKLKELHAKNVAVSRHRRVFSNAIKTFNKSFHADFYLDSDFEIVDRTTVVVNTSSDSDAVVVEEKEKPKKRKRLRNPYSILNRISKDVNVGASTSQQVPVLRTLSLNVINDNTSQNSKSDNANIASTIEDKRAENLLKSFYMARFPNNDFGGAELYSRVDARLDALLSQVEYLQSVSKEELANFESWVDIKLAALKDIRESLDLEKQQVEALSNDFFTTETRLQPILGSNCTDLKSALKKLAIIPTNKEIPSETSLRIHFDACNRDVHFKKSNPPKPNFRVVCYDESASFPSTEDVVGLQARYTDGVPTVFAFVGISGSISYLQINSINLPTFIPDNLLS